jgi:hypothetical protein
MKYLLVPLILFALAGCDTMPKVPTEVKIPIALPCKVATPTPPQYMFGTLTADNTIWDKVKVLLSDRQLALGYELELEVALAACK